MAISRYWRLVGICTLDNGPLELSEARLYEGGVIADASAIFGASIAPLSGVLSDLRDGLTTSVVSWPYTSYSQPGFALTWDFGAGAGIEFAQLSLGSGSSVNTFAIDLVLQNSSDGVYWSTYAAVKQITYPGAFSQTDTTFANTDAYWSKVSLLMVAEGANGSTAFTDKSPLKNTVLPYGNTQISMARSKYNSSSFLFDGAGDAIGLPVSTAFQFGAEDFTIEGWVYLTSAAGTQTLFFYGSSGTTNDSTFIWLSGGTLQVILGFGATLYGAESPALTAGVWNHFAAVRAGASLKMYLNGIGGAVKDVGSASIGIPNASPVVNIGGLYTASTLNFSGNLDHLRITKGVARYTSDFTPPASAFPMAGFMEVDAEKARARVLSPGLQRVVPAEGLPDTTATGHPREHTFFDVYNGGVGNVFGTVKEKNTPNNTPLRRRVLLIDEASRMTIRETWSDASTGSYEFRGVKQGVKYTVLSYDHTGAYRAVVADGQTASIV